MSGVRRWLPVILSGVVVAGGCGDPPDSAEPEETATKPHVWQEQTDALERARGVEDTLKEAERKRREALEDQGG